MSSQLLLFTSYTSGYCDGSYRWLPAGGTAWSAILVKNFITPILLSAALMVGACAGPDIPEQIERPVDDLYNEALDAAMSGDAEAAAPQFEEVERQHPYSTLAVRAQLMAAWSFYQANNYARAISGLERFIELNPADQRVEYAYYLIALSYYEQIVDVERDAEMTRLALAAFEELQRRFPNGTYGRDALLKIDLTRSHMAGKEMAVGRFYAERQQYGAAIRRFERVITDFDTTNQVPEALFRLTESYLALGLIEEAGRVGSVARYNFPDSVWTQRLDEMAADPERDLPVGLFEQTVDAITGLFDR